MRNAKQNFLEVANELEHLVKMIRYWVKRDTDNELIGGFVYSRCKLEEHAANCEFLRKQHEGEINNE